MTDEQLKNVIFAESVWYDLQKNKMTDYRIIEKLVKSGKARIEQNENMIRCVIDEHEVIFYFMVDEFKKVEINRLEDIEIQEDKE